MSENSPSKSLDYATTGKKMVQNKINIFCSEQNKHLLFVGEQLLEYSKVLMKNKHEDKNSQRQNTKEEWTEGKMYFFK